MRKTQKGASAIEYSLLVAFIAIAVIYAIVQLGQAAQDRLVASGENFVGTFTQEEYLLIAHIQNLQIVDDLPGEVTILDASNEPVYKALEIGTEFGVTPEDLGDTNWMVGSDYTISFVAQQYPTPDDTETLFSALGDTYKINLTGTSGNAERVIEVNHSGTTISTTNTYPLDQWTAITVTYTNSSQTASVYVNGVQVPTTSQTLPALTGSGNGYIGGTSASTDQFEGAAAGFAAWSRTLNAEQILDIHTHNVEGGSLDE